jgi:uncharacterized damage-inducible protein DinB
MNGKEAVKSILHSTMGMYSMFLSDLSDADLLVRPVPNANHTAWQLGHLISAEVGMASGLLPGVVYPTLPAGFHEQHEKGTAAMEPPKGFATKEVYLKLFGQVREATLAAVDKLTDADLSKPTTGSMAKWAPTLGDLLILTSNHVLMHLGQVTVVRRKLGKPVIF